MSPPRPEPIFTLESIGLKNGAGWLFQGLSLTLDARDRVALIGRNGAGKSALLKIIDGSIEPDQGRRALAGRLKIGRLEQDPPMGDFEALEDYVLAGGAQPHEVAALADQIGLDLARPAATASGGERRRAALVRVLAEAPDLLLLDEPTNGLDPQGTREVRSLVASLAADGATVLISSHLLSEVEQICSHLGVMRQGRLVAQGAIGEVRAGSRPVAEVKTGTPDQAADVLRGLGLTEVTVTESGVRAVPNGIDPELIVAGLVSAGVGVRAFSVQSPSLEDLFVALTGEGFDVSR